MLQQRIGNAIYDRCRGQTLTLTGFPNYDPLVASLKESAPSAGDVSYKVCVVRHDRLLVLQSLAKRWLEYEGTKDDALAMVETHNKAFNQGGEFMENDERTPEWIFMAHRWKMTNLLLLLSITFNFLGSFSYSCSSTFLSCRSTFPVHQIMQVMLLELDQEC